MSINKQIKNRHSQHLSFYTFKFNVSLFSMKFSFFYVRKKKHLHHSKVFWQEDRVSGGSTCAHKAYSADVL